MAEVIPQTSRVCITCIALYVVTDALLNAMFFLC